MKGKYQGIACVLLLALLVLPLACPLSAGSVADGPIRGKGGEPLRIRSSDFPAEGRVTRESRSWAESQREVYKIPRWVVNAGGCWLSSEDYELYASIGEAVIGELGNTQYTLYAGLLIDKGPPSETFVRGDATADGTIDMFDGLRIIFWLGGNADPPPCQVAADATDDDAVNMFDALRIIYWLGGNADPPPAPCCVPPEDCGTDPTPDGLTCTSYPPCGASGGNIFKIASAGSAEESWLAVEPAMAVGRIVVIPVTLVNAEPLVGFSWIIEYDADLLTAKVVDNAGLATEKFDVFVGGVREPGLVKVVAVSDMEIGDGVKKLPAGEHQVARVIFEIKGTPDRDVALDLIEGVMAIGHDRALNHQLVNGVIKPAIELPKEFGLSQNYPNPFNQITEIQYTLPVACHVKLEVYNILGQKVAPLVDENQKAGYRVARWDARAASSGIYLYRLQAGEYAETRRMILLK